ncbi:expressed unknown protein [Seminavis robusta]|uniref:Uncharacterized protein n=1 Tax=Seminavis robusta TaxID=568900 RepID=A0A9N8HCN8_9STRA|nr:expressed unknown protein [Seminavis robusta]|eukprot:Sro325_g117910.1 n/a (233) ;mRNA; r:66084-66782
MNFYKASRFNKQAASFLALGDYDAALESLAAAATILRDLPVRMEAGDEHHESLAEIMLAAQRSIASCTTASFLSGGNIPVLQEGSNFYIFSRALLFHADKEDEYELLTHSQHSFCISMVVFNMGLGRHAQAKKTGKDSFLEKALSFYEMSWELLQVVEAPLMESVCLLALAIMNNMAEIHLELGDVCTSQMLLESIQPLVSELSDDTVAKTQADECCLNSMITNGILVARCA